MVEVGGVAIGKAILARQRRGEQGDDRRRDRKRD
jgi:hypothetical protein